MIQNNKMLTKLRSPKDKQITHSAFLIQITILKKIKLNYLRGQMHQDKTTEHKVYPFEIS